MYGWEKAQSEGRLRTNPTIPSFSSGLLDEIYRSIDCGDKKSKNLTFPKERTANKYRNDGGGAKAKTTSIEDKDMANLGRACLIEKRMEKKINGKVSAPRLQSLPELEIKSELDKDPLFLSSSSSSSDSSFGGFSISSSETDSLGGMKSRASCFAASSVRPKTVRTSVETQSPKVLQSEFYYMFDDWQDHQHLKNKEGVIQSKLRVLNIYNSLKKVRQPISPGGRLSSFINSLFTNRNAKKTKNSRAVGGYDQDASLERKSKASTCSSASSFSRSCLSKSSANSRKNDGVKRTVRFHPVSVIIDEDCRPCGHKCIYEATIEHKYEEERMEQLRSNEDSRPLTRFMEKNGKILEEIKHQNQRKSHYFMNRKVGDGDGDDDGDDSASDCSSSDLFEIDHLALMGNNKRYYEELPVFETTHLDSITNRAIANGLIR